MRLPQPPNAAAAAHRRSVPSGPRLAQEHNGCWTGTGPLHSVERVTPASIPRTLLSASMAAVVMLCAAQLRGGENQPPPAQQRVISDHDGRRSVHLLSRGRSEGRAADPAPSRASLLLPHVRAASHPSRGSLPHDRAGLPWLRTQRFAKPQGVRVHLRSPYRRDGSLHGGGGAAALHPLHAGLRRPRRFPYGTGSPRADRRADRPGRRRPQRGARRELEDAPQVLGRSRGARGGAEDESVVVGHDAGATRRKRSAGRTIRPRPLDRRVRVPHPTGRSGHPERPLLRLPHQRGGLPVMAGMAAQDAAAIAGHLGQI